ncbi:unnamed protein product [Urochloa humidicola]
MDAKGIGAQNSDLYLPWYQRLLLTILHSVGWLCLDCEKIKQKSLDAFLDTRLVSENTKIHMPDCQLDTSEHPCLQSSVTDLQFAIQNSLDVALIMFSCSTCLNCGVYILLL